MRKLAKRLGIKTGSMIDAQSFALFLAEGFLLITITWSVFGKLPVSEKINNIFICALVSALLIMPWVFERCFGVELPGLLKILLIMLILGGPVLGKIYKFYYKIGPWDKILHTSSGFLFAAIGALIPQLVDKKNKEHSTALVLTCAFCFTLTIAVLWEFFEYGMDKFFNMDMQQDAWVPAVNSYLLGAEKGVIGRIPEIISVIVNGEQIAVNGYLDIGLIDTMNDMLVCTLGGLIYCACRMLYHHRVKALAWFKNIIPTIADQHEFMIPSGDFVHAGADAVLDDRRDDSK